MPSKKPQIDNTGNPYVRENRDNPSCLRMNFHMILLMIILTINFAIGIGLLCYGIYVLSNKESSLYHLRILTTNLNNSFIVNLTFANPICWGITSAIPFGVLMGLLCAKSTESANNLMKAVFGVCLIIGLVQLVLCLIPMVWLSGTTGPIVKSLLESSLRNDYIGLPEASFQESTLSLLWDDLMILKLCCGVSGEYDFIPSLNFIAAAWVNTEKQYTMSTGAKYTNAEINLPMTCCKLTSTEIRQTDTWYNIQNYLIDELCPIQPTVDNSYKNVGCNGTIYSDLATYTTETSIGLILMSLVMLIGSVIAAVGAFKRVKMKKVEPVAARKLNTYATTVGGVRAFDTRPTGAPPSQPQPRISEIPVVPLQATASNERNGLYYTNNGQVVRS